MICKQGKKFYIAIALLFISSFSYAQQDSSVTVDSSITEGQVDSANADTDTATDTVITRTIFKNHIDSIISWKRSREFGYMAYLDSLLHKKKLITDTVNIENGSLSKSKSLATTSNSNANSILNSFPLKIIFWLLAIFFIGFILYRLFFKSGLFTKDSSGAKEEVAVEELEKLNEFSAYNALISQAESTSDFNLAARYLYLQTLKGLSERELIFFSPDKTNKNYINELSGRNYQQQFELLTRNYEYIWYGKFIIGSNIYQQLKEQFISFNKKI